MNSDNPVILEKEDGWKEVTFDVLSNAGQHEIIFTLSDEPPADTQKVGHPFPSNGRLSYSELGGSRVWFRTLYHSVVLFRSI